MNSVFQLVLFGGDFLSTIAVNHRTSECCEHAVFPYFRWAKPDSGWHLKHVEPHFISPSAVPSVPPSNKPTITQTYINCCFNCTRRIELYLSRRRHGGCRWFPWATGSALNLRCQCIVAVQFIAMHHFFLYCRKALSCSLVSCLCCCFVFFFLHSSNSVSSSRVERSMGWLCQQRLEPYIAWNKDDDHYHVVQDAWLCGIAWQL